MISIFISWDPPLSDGGLPILDYAIYRGTSTQTEILIAKVPDPLNYTDTDIVSGQTYYYEVVAVNGIGSGLFSQ